MTEGQAQGIAAVSLPGSVAINGPVLRRAGQAERDPYLSVVVPIFNEAENIEGLLTELRAGLERTGRSYEILCIDDGSTDASFALLRAAHARDPRVVAIRFRRNFGQTPAFAAGFDRARGEWVITIDADLQNDPADIPMLLEKAEEGYDVVSGWRVARQDVLIARKLPSRVANWLIGRVTGVALHDYGCSLKVYHRDVIKSVKLYGELHRFVPAVASSMGIRWTEMAVNHRARRAGDSKYTGFFRTLSRTVKVALDLMTVRFLLTYSTRPAHVFGGLGLLTGGLGVAIGLYLTFEKLVGGQDLAGRPLLMLAVLLVVVGVQLVSLGLVGEFVIRTYHESQRKPIYVIREVLIEDDTVEGE